MELLLERYSNDYFYMYGVIKEGSDYVCDTLEFGNYAALKDGLYLLDINVDRVKNERYIEIKDLENNTVSRFVKCNTIFYKNIELRLPNNHICLGTKILDPWLVMNQYVNQLLGVKVAGCKASGEICQLLIKSLTGVIIEYDCL